MNVWSEVHNDPLMSPEEEGLFDGFVKEEDMSFVIDDDDNKNVDECVQHAPLDNLHKNDDDEILYAMFVCPHCHISEEDEEQKMGPNEVEHPDIPSYNKRIMFCQVIFINRKLFKPKMTLFLLCSRVHSNEPTTVIDLSYLFNVVFSSLNLFQSMPTH